MILIYKACKLVMAKANFETGDRQIYIQGIGLVLFATKHRSMTIVEMHLFKET